MEFIKKIIHSFGKTGLFFTGAVTAAICYHFSAIAYIAVAIITIFITMKNRVSFVTVIIFISLHFISSSFFVVTSLKKYENYTTIYSGSGKISIDTKYNVKEGDIIVAKFKKDKTRSKPFFKPFYKAETPVKVYDVPFISSILQLRDRLSHNLFFASGGRVTVAQALIFGDKQFISNKIKDTYIVSGLSHMLAMSGMHVGIIIAIMFTVFSFLPKKIRIIPAIIGVTALIFFGAFSITVLRATFFAIICMSCYFFDIKIDRKKFMLFIAGLFLIFSPESIGDISFLLSFSAVAGIIYLVDYGKSFIKAALLTGVAATLLTAPLSLYVFGTTNHLSILSTVIMSPIIYLHILFAIMASFVPSICIAPLIAIETFSNYAVYIIYKLTYFGFILKYIPLTVLIITTLFIIITGLSKYKWLSALSLLIIFYPTSTPPDVLFPKLYGQNKGFMIFEKGRNEVFFQGNLSSFKYNFLPEAAKYGIKSFDYGSITIFGEENLYLSIKEIGKEFTNLCINGKNNDCNLVYHTRSNSIKKSDLDNRTTHVIYKSKLKDKSILSVYEHGRISINKGKVFLEK